MHMNQYPGGSGRASVAPGFPYGTIRTLSCRFHNWGGINTSAGVYDWSIVDQYNALGKTLLWTVFGTPVWAAKVADQAIVGPLGNLAESGCPQNLSDLGTFITALMTRYNSGATKPIKWIEYWNEPNYLQNHTQYFWGSAPELIGMCYTIKTAALAVDPTVKFLSPGFNTVADMVTFLNAQDPTSLKYGRELIDGLSYHPYFADATYQSAVNANNVSFLPRYNDVKKALSDAGIPNIPIYVTEFGVGSNPADGPTTNFNNRTPAFRATWLKRMLAIYAALGVQVAGPYDYDVALCGDLVSDTTGSVQALIDFSAAIPGKTIQRAVQDDDGTLSITMQGGPTYVW